MKLEYLLRDKHFIRIFILISYPKFYHREMNWMPPVKVSRYVLKISHLRRLHFLLARDSQSQTNLLAMLGRHVGTLTFTSPLVTLADS